MEETSSFARSSTPVVLDEHMQMPQPTRLGARPSLSVTHCVDKFGVALLLATRSGDTRQARLEHHCFMCRC